ncbi:MAG: SDR family NAD(P)-dependent oxidoreductase [Candidatus Methylacidiphilales bacterium]|nr:SDR family NAD(P)-dependent oxidoreductase [Candidatus Methylacidiphilales bacterium]
MAQGQALITGGTGFIGRHVVRRLARMGMPVRVLARRPESATRLFPQHAGSVEVIAGDLRDARDVARAAAGVESIYHIGGLYGFGPGPARDAETVNLDGTRHVMEAALLHHTPRVVHVSTAGVLRPCRQRAGSDRQPPEMTEEDFPDQPGWGERYKRSKWMAERLALDYAAQGLPVIIASPTCPIGAEDEGPTPTGRIIKDFLGGRFPMVSRTGLNFLAVEDLAAGLIRAAERGVPGRRYILGGKNLWLREFLELTARITGRQAPGFSAPWLLVLAAGLAGEAAGSLGLDAGGWSDRVCLETALTARRCQFFDTTRTQRELGWKPEIPLERAVREAVAWFETGAAGPHAAAERDVAYLPGQATR